MVQRVKLLILSFFLILFVEEQCMANEVEKYTPSAERSVPALHRDSYRTDGLSTFIYILLSNTADLADTPLHTSYDKKSYIRLFIHPRDHKVYPPFHNESQAMPYPPDVTESGHISYYVFALRKIII